MIRHLAVIGTLAAFAGAPAMAQQATAPGQVMNKSVSVSGTKGASAYAPGHLKKKQRIAIKGRPGASGYAPGHAAETRINTRSGMTTGSSVSTRTTGSSVTTRSDMTTGSTAAPSRRMETGSQR